MHCYKHRDVEAIGVCGMCGRGVCATCVRESPTKLTCSDACSAEAEAQKTVIDFSKRNVSVTKSMRYPTYTVWMFAMGLIFVGWGLFDWLERHHDVDWFLFALGIVFIAMGANMYRLTKKVTRD